MTLSDLVRSKDPIIANTANLTVSTMAAFQAKEISVAEYAELMKNILDFEAVKKLTDDMNRQNEIANALSELESIASALSSLTSL